MPAKNEHLDNAVPNFFRRNALHLTIWAFIDTYKFIMPSVTVNEAARAYMIRHKVDESEFSLNTVVQTYMRVNQDLIDAERFQNKQRGKQG